MSEPEELLGWQLKAIGIPYEREVTPIPGRKLRYDFQVDDMLIEIQGGVWAKGDSGHTSGKGITRDCEKNNLAVEHGYRHLMFTTSQVSIGEAVGVIERCRR